MARKKKENNNHKKELSKDDYKRQSGTRDRIPDVIISCEDTESIPEYLNQMVKVLIKSRIITQDSFIIVSHDVLGGTNPSKVLERLKKYKDSNGKTYKDFQHKWIVIDRDIERVNGGGHTSADFNKAIQSAKNVKQDLNIEVAYSNDSFELWYLLHFDYICTPILRDELNTRLIKKLKELNPIKFKDLNEKKIKTKEYTKLIYEELLKLQPVAIRNAKRLLESYVENHNPEKDNPSTTIHKLVEILNSFYPNDSVELWYLLHFMPVDNVVLRNEILEELIKKLKEKNSTVFKDLDITNFKESEYIKLINDELLELQTEAVKNAKTFLNFYERNKYPKLIEILNNIESK